MGRRQLFGWMLFGFVLLGMPIGALGVAWPSIADELERTIAELGVLTLAFGAGYTATTLASGELTRRMGTGLILSLAAGLATIGAAGLVTVQSWSLFVLAAVVLGCGGGLLDAGVNSWVALHRGTRSMGFVHAAFGVGSALGPLLVTLLLVAERSWRLAFAALALLYLILLLAFLRLRAVAPRSKEASLDRPSFARAHRLLGLSVTAFFLYAGVAGGTGAWAFSVLSEGRDIDVRIAGLAVTAYWAGLTAARLLLGLVGHKIRPDRLITASAVATLATLLVFWWAPTPWIGVGAMVLSGFAHGPYFPLQILETARRFGATRTPWVVGYEIGAANVGFAAVPAVIGLLVREQGLEVVAPAVVGVACGLVVVTQLLRASSDIEPEPHSASEPT